LILVTPFLSFLLLEVISRSTRFKEFNREKKQQQKHRISLKSFRE
jgi:hypothetical protein